MSGGAALDMHAAESLSDRELAVRLFPPGDGRPAFKAPNYAAIHRELAKPGMTQQLLWMEYCDQCRPGMSNPADIFSQCEYYGG